MLADNSIFDVIYKFIWLINILLIAFIIYSGRNKDPRSTLMWGLLLSFIPVGGFILWLIFGHDYRKRKMFKIKYDQDVIVRNLVDLQQQEILSGEFTSSKQEVINNLSLLNQNLKIDGSIYSDKNECRLFFSGIEKFESLFNDLENAKKSICVQYYIFRNDDIGSKFLNLLIKKQKEGVNVRLLVDAIGSRRLKKSHYSELIEYGGKVALFFPYIGPINFRLNYRNHRKLVIIDDYIGYIGGYNVGDDYLGKYKKMGYWRDTHLRIEGAAVADMKLRFIKDWIYASGEDPSDEDSIYSIPNLKGNVGMQLVTSGPDTNYANIKYAMITMINSAKKSIEIQTPYFIPDLAIFDSLVTKILSGVEVKLMIPNKPDHIGVYWATTSFAGELLKAGARVFVYNNGFLHAKVLTIDDSVSLIGSANMDERSFSLNFEASEVIYDMTINKQLRQQYKQDIKRCKEWTIQSRQNRPWIQKIKEPIARLFSPIL